MAELLLTKKYKSKTFNVPFYESQTDLHKVKLKVDKITSNEELEQNRLSILEAACDEFITSNLPEFYSSIYDEEYFQTNCDPEPECGNILDVAFKIRQEIIDRSNVEAWFQPDNPAAQNTIAIVSLEYDFDSRREQLEAKNRMPLYEPNLQFFNDQQGFTGPVGETTLTIGTIGAQNKLLNNGLRTFDTQFKGFEGQINLNVDFNVLGVNATKIMNIIITELSKQVRIQTPSSEFSDADTITLIFGKSGNKLALYGMEYLLLEDSIENKPLTIGYFSIAKYNNLLRDPLTLSILRNYDAILSSIQDANRGSNTYSFFDFLSNEEVQDSLGNPGTVFDNFNRQPKKELNNDFIREANELGLIDINNTDALERGFVTFLSSEEVQELRKNVTDNPDVFKRVFAAQKSRNLSTAVDVTEAIDNILNLNVFGQGSLAGQLLRQVGVDDLAREAFTCLTFGLNVEIGRINQAVQNSLVRKNSSIYYQPDLPKASSIALPSVDIDALRPWSITKDLWDGILKTITDSIQQTVLEVIKKLADVLKENCNLNSPRSTDFGNNNIVDFMKDEPNSENDLLPSVGAGSQLDQLASKNGLSNEDVLKYLTDISSILSSIDICTLFLNRAGASDELIDRILDFNGEYELEYVRTELSSRTAIMGFFADVSAMVDVSDLCNSIANELYDINQDNVCLVPDDDAENLQELLDLIESGLVIDPPNIDLECPDSEFASPLVTKSIPETFNSLAETIQVQFISSADSAKEILLEPVLSNESRTLDALSASNVEFSGSSINTDILKTIINVMNGITGTLDLDSCPVPIEEVLGVDPLLAVDASRTVLDVVTETIQDPQTFNAILNISDKLTELSASAAEGPQNPVFTTYKFNQEFLNNFRSYIDISTLSYNNLNNSTTTEKFYSSDVPNLVAGTGAPFYRPLALKFNFDKDYTSTELLKLSFPRYTTEGQPQSVVNLNTRLVSSEQSGTLDIINKETAAPITMVNEQAPNGENLFVKQFASKLLASPNVQSEEEAYYKYFPEAYGTLVNQMFDYVISNGIFDAATLQSLNLFTLNEGCPPDQVADFLDIDGIVKQMIEEYKESACNRDDVELSSKVRNTIKYGMYLLLVQIHIAEVIIKNIFVMAAYNLEDILNRDGFVFQFVRGQILRSLEFYFAEQAGQSEQSMLRQDLIKYFNLKLQRPTIVAEGGITFVNGDVAIPGNTQLSVATNFDEVLDFLVYDRLLRSTKAINNALKKALPNTQQLSFNKAFLSSLPRLAVDRDDAVSVVGMLLQEAVQTYLPQDGFFMTVKERVVNVGATQRQLRYFKLWWKIQNSAVKILDMGIKTKNLDPDGSPQGFVPAGSQEDGGSSFALADSQDDDDSDPTSSAVLGNV